MKTHCPGCGDPLGPHWAEDDEEPGSVAILSCFNCGHVAAWDTDLGAWRPPTTQEHDMLMADDTWLSFQQASMARQMWRIRDREQLCALLHSRLDRLGIPKDEIDALAGEIMEADYHTHPGADDLAMLGLITTEE